MRKFKWICVFGAAALCGCTALDPDMAAKIQEALNKTGDAVAMVPLPYMNYVEMGLTVIGSMIVMAAGGKGVKTMVNKVKNSEPGKVFGPSKEK